METANLSKSGKNGIITEISIMKKFKHPNIIKMEDFSWDDKYVLSLYFTVLYVNNSELNVLSLFLGTPLFIILFCFIN